MCLNVSSWNINRLILEKFNGKSFVDFICKYDVVFHSECYSDKSNNYEDHKLSNVFDINIFHRGYF